MLCRTSTVSFLEDVQVPELFRIKLTTLGSLDSILREGATSAMSSILAQKLNQVVLFERFIFLL